MSEQHKTVLHELIEKWRGETFQGDLAASQLNVAVICAEQLEEALKKIDNQFGLATFGKIHPSCYACEHPGVNVIHHCTLGSNTAVPPALVEPDCFCSASSLRHKRGPGCTHAWEHMS